jgi:hypothetical protein
MEKAVTKKKKKAKRPAIDKKTREEIQWLLVTLENANDVIVTDGIDDDHEAFEVRCRMFEICERHGIKGVLDAGFDPNRDPHAGEFDDPD